MSRPSLPPPCPLAHQPCPCAGPSSPTRRTCTGDASRAHRASCARARARLPPVTTATTAVPCCPDVVALGPCRFAAICSPRLFPRAPCAGVASRCRAPSTWVVGAAVHAGCVRARRTRSHAAGVGGCVAPSTQVDGAFRFRAAEPPLAPTERRPSPGPPLTPATVVNRSATHDAHLPAIDASPWTRPAARVSAPSPWRGTRRSRSPQPDGADEPSARTHPRVCYGSTRHPVSLALRSASAEPLSPQWFRSGQPERNNAPASCCLDRVLRATAHRPGDALLNTACHSPAAVTKRRPAPRATDHATAAQQPPPRAWPQRSHLGDATADPPPTAEGRAGTARVRAPRAAAPPPSARARPPGRRGSPGRPRGRHDSLQRLPAC